MLKELNILSIDEKILENFRNEKEKLFDYKCTLTEIEKSLELENLSQRVKNSLVNSREELIKQIECIETNSSINFYITESAEILEKFKDILNAPMKVNFMGKSIKKNKEKEKLINDYIEIANKYVIIELEQSTSDKKDSIFCANCDNKKDFDILDGNIYVCINCSAQQVIMKNVSSYRDIDRINISSKYTYDRKIHFRDCINQYQGKQNCTIHQKVYDDLEIQFDLHHLLQGNKKSPKFERFKNITKEHVSIFLKELEYSKHYENINLIHYNITGKKPDDITYIEYKLLEDFDILTDLYDKHFKHLERKNFINTQYVLYQLLLRHKHPCIKEDFSILKTVDRKSFHDEIARFLFELCGWNFIPFY